jgi:hypothetical protein
LFQVTRIRKEKMDSKTRGNFLIAGSIISFIGFVIPALYGVNYDPPAQSAAAQIDISKLPDFQGAIMSTGGGVYNGFS